MKTLSVGTTMSYTQKNRVMDLQIYPNEFSVSFNLNEPDEDIKYPLESKEQLYSVLFNTIKVL